MASTLTSGQLGELRRRLEDERNRLLRVLSSPAPSGTQPDQEIELEEAAQRETERARRTELERREQALLAEVERALVKLSEGRYGTSEKTGDPIPYERLVAVPWARDAVGE
ncbi:MAG TPA: TraR/DksA family transcriptional regulator [Anaeromyxobacter sp.]